jgi:hypothetical protein
MTIIYFPWSYKRKNKKIRNGQFGVDFSADLTARPFIWKAAPKGAGRQVSQLLACSQKMCTPLYIHTIHVSWVVVYITVIWLQFEWIAVVWEAKNTFFRPKWGQNHITAQWYILIKQKHHKWYMIWTNITHGRHECTIVSANTSLRCWKTECKNMQFGGVTMLAPWWFDTDISNAGTLNLSYNRA